MKAPLSANIKKIFKENKYDHWIYRTSVLPKQLQEAGFNVEVTLAGEDGTELRYILHEENGPVDVTEYINSGINNAIESNKVLVP